MTIDKKPSYKDFFFSHCIIHFHDGAVNLTKRFDKIMHFIR